MRQRKQSDLKSVGFWVIAVFVTLGSITLQPGYAQQENPTECTLATLRGRYVFDATGYNIVNGSPVPKTVVEFLTFKGDGSLTSIATAVVDGNIIANDAPGTGSYTVNDDCTGTLTFNWSGLTFDLFIAPHGGGFHMIETVTGQMLAGEARRVDRQGM
jgi:hypothetical protein